MTSETVELTDLRPIEQAKGDPRRWLALPVLLTGAFLPILDFNVVNLALPAIRGDLGATSSQVQFVISAYAATYAVFLITGGRLGDIFGRRRMFLGGVAGFTIASLLCGIAWSPAVLVAGRILQGFAATMMAPQVLASIRVLFPPEEQSRALGLYGATFGLANICGQILGGVLVSSHPFGLAWQAIFLINLPIGVAAFAGGLLFLSDSRPPYAQKLDIGGVVLLSLTLGLLVYPLVEGRESGWPIWMVAMLVASPVALFAFVRFEAHLSKRGGDPLVALHLLRNSAFAIGLVMALAFYMLSSFYLTFAVYLQSGLHETPLAAGLSTLPFATGFFAASLVSSYVMQGLGVRALTLGFVLQVLGFGLVMLAVSNVLPQSLTIGLICGGLGFGTVVPSVIKAVIGSIDPRHAGLASGIMISTFQIGAALGVAIIGGIFYSALGRQQDLQTYAHAFTLSLGCNVALLALAALLSLGFPTSGPPIANLQTQRIAMKLMIEGTWRGDVNPPPGLQAQQMIHAGSFRDRITADGSSKFQAEAGRYHLYLSPACPFSHRVLVVRALKRLEGFVGLSILHPLWDTPDGWIFAVSNLSTNDGAGNGFRYLHEAYCASSAAYTGKVTVPVLWDKRSRRIVNNESLEIVQMPNQAFDGIGGEKRIDLYPADLRPALDDLNRRVNKSLSVGVYSVAAANNQREYEAAMDELFGFLDELDWQLCGGRRFLLGDDPTLADVLVYATLVRFDIVYNPLFRASRRRLTDYPHLPNMLKRLHELPGVAETLRYDHVLTHYYDGDWAVAHRRGIVPELPTASWLNR